MTRRHLRRWVLATLLVAFTLPCGYLVHRWWGGNVAEVVPGRVVRSAQLSPGQLRSLIARRGVRTVLNLRGPNPRAAWYRAERATTLAAGATQVDLPIASDLWLSRAQAWALVEVLDYAEPPILAHCQWGAERTGLVSAMAALLRPGSTLGDADRCFSFHYLYAPTRDGKMMEGHVRAYQEWLEGGPLEHSPERFRHWVREVYRPGVASPESWPYQPGPLMVVTRPAPARAPLASRPGADVR